MSEVADRPACSSPGGHGGSGGSVVSGASRPARIMGYLLNRLEGTGGIPVAAWFEGHLYWHCRTDGRPVITVSLCQNAQGAFLFDQLAPARVMCALLNAHDEHNACDHMAWWRVVTAHAEDSGGYLQ